MIRHRSITVLVLAGFAAGCASNRNPTEPATSPAVAEATARPADARHLLVVMRATATGIQIVDAKVVPLPLPLDRGRPVRRPDAWRAELLDAAGATLAAVDLDPPMEVRGEPAAPDGTIEPHHVTLDSGDVIVRFPIVATASTLKLSAPAGGTAAPSAAGSAWREVGRAALPQGARP